MKKILSLLTAMFCAGCLLAQKSGELQIPSVEHGSISVTRDDTPLGNGDTVRAGETLNIVYSATSPWFVVGEDTLSLTLTDEMISGGQIDLNLSSQGWDAITSENEYCSRATGWIISTLSYYDKPSTGDKTASVATSFVGEKKLSFMWNLDRDYANWGKFILTCTVNGVEKVKHDMTGDLTHGCGDFFYDTISYVGTGNDEIKWICRRTGNHASQWGDGSSRNFYLDEVHICGGFTVPTPKLDRNYSIELPKMDHATVSATLNGSAFTGGKALIGDTLVMTYTSTDPEKWFFSQNKGTEIKDTLILSESSFDSNEQLVLTLPEMYELVSYQITLPELDHATVSATLNGSAFTGGEAIEGDSLVLTYTSNDPKHWFFSRGALDTIKVDTIVLSDYSFDKEGNLLIKMEPMFERKDYYVSIAPYAHMTFIVTQNGDTITGSHNLAHVDDEIEIYAHADKGYYFMYNYDTVLVTGLTLEEDMFGEDSTYYLRVPIVCLSQPNITDVDRIDSTTALIKWEGEYEDYEIRVSSEEPTGDDRYWKGIRPVKGYEYQADNLIPGKRYYVALRAVKDTIYSEWTFTNFEAGNTSRCTLSIHMTSDNKNGWRGARLVITEEGYDITRIYTMQSDNDVTEDHYTDGGYVTITWNTGTNYRSISGGFEIRNKHGNIIAKASEDEINSFRNGQVIYEGYPCSYDESARIEDITWSVDETATQYLINWTASNSKTYEIVVTQDPNITEEQLESQAIRRKVAAYSFESERAYAFFNVYVRGVRKDGEKGEWKKRTIFNNRSGIKEAEKTILEVCQEIELDYHKNGSLLSDAIGVSNVIALPYTFTIQDTTVLSASFRAALSNDMPYMPMIEVFRAEGDSLQEIYFGQNISWSDSILPGQYALAFAIVSPTGLLEFADYEVNIQLGGKLAQDSLIVTPIQLDTVITADFTKAQDIVLHDMGNMPALACTYSITPKDTVGVMLYLEMSNRSGGINLYKGQSMQLIASPGAGSLKTYTFYKDTTYYIQVVTVPMMGGDKTDNFTLTVKRMVPDTTAKVIRPISTDTIIESQLTINDFDLLDGRYMHYYSFECTKATNMYMYVEKIEKEMPSNVPGGIVIGPGLASTTVLQLSKDSLAGDMAYSTSSSNNSFAPLTLGTDGDTTRYFITIFSTQSDEYRLVVRSDMDYDNPGGQLIEVGEHVKSKIDNEDGYSFAMAPGYSKAYRVQLEKGKKYVAIASDESNNKKTAPVNGSITPGTGIVKRMSSSLALFMMQPGAKNGSLVANIANAATGSPDDWRAFSFTADTTAEYTFLVNASNNNTSIHMSPVEFEFVINEYIEFAEYMQQLDTITGSLNEHGEMTNKDVKVHCDAHFQTPRTGSYITSVAGVYNVAGHAVKIPAGDTLFAQFALDNADAILYVIDGNDTTYIDDSGNKEEFSIVNDADTARVIYVIGTTYGFSIEDHNYSLRFGFGEKSMDPDTIVARPSETSITVMYDATFATIQEKLLALDIEVFNSNDSLITIIPNSLEWWTIDLDNKVASYEVNNYDLPMGYVFRNGVEKVNVTINIKQPEVVVARASVDSITIYDDATTDDIKALLAQISIAAYDSKDNVITTINTEVDMWTIDETNNVATYELTNSVLPKYYTFKGEKATVTVSIVRKQRQGIEDVHGDDVQCTKILRDGNIYILRDGKVYTIMGQTVR